MHYILRVQTVYIQRGHAHTRRKHWSEGGLEQTGEGQEAIWPLFSTLVPAKSDSICTAVVHSSLTALVYTPLSQAYRCRQVQREETPGSGVSVCK